MAQTHSPAHSAAGTTSPTPRSLCSPAPSIESHRQLIQIHPPPSPSHDNPPPANKWRTRALLDISPAHPECTSELISPHLSRLSPRSCSSTPAAYASSKTP